MTQLFGVKKVHFLVLQVHECTDIWHIFPSTLSLCNSYDSQIRNFDFCCNILFCFKNSYVQQVKLILAQPTTTNYKLYQKPFECSVRAEQCCLFTISSCCLKRPIPDVNHRNVCSLKDKVCLNGTKWTNTHDTESGKQSHMVSCFHLYFFEICLEPKLLSYA